MFARFGVLLILGVVAHLALSSYDVGRMSAVGNVAPQVNVRTRCKSSAAFALTGALEVAYHKATGRRREYSAQEIIDCYHRQCDSTRMDNLVNWLVVNDRLAPKDKYTDYKAKAFTCRAGTSPDGLTNIKVAGLIKVTPENFERAIRRNGAVLACVDTTVGGCPDYDKYSGGVVRGNSSRTEQYCTEQVLIVGFDESTYRVRASRGASWGQNGYFKITRGGNTCGIEQSMTVLEVEARTSKPTLNRRTLCPVAFPKYCTKTRTCRKTNQRCSAEIKQTKASSSSSSQRISGGSSRPSGGSSSGQAGYRPLPSGGRPVIPSGGSSSGSFSGLSPGSFGGSFGGSSGYSFGRSKRDARCEDKPGFNCPAVAAHCKIQRIRDTCGKTCGVCDESGERVCKDTEQKPGECAALKKYCDRIPSVRVKCAATCNANPEDCEESSRPSINYDGDIQEPPKGLCYAPTVLNGRVLNGGYLQPGDELRIRCDPGFTLIGEPNTCEIQNVFAPDTRRLQECVRLGDEDFEGNGANYNGALDTVVTNRVCENWLKLAHTGLFRGLERGQTLLKGGNHNFCRNIGGEDFTPFCYTSAGQLKEYCFELPGCGGNESDKCSAVRTNKYDNCARDYESWSCELTDERSKSRTEWYWSNCAAMCCEYAGCQ